MRRLVLGVVVALAVFGSTACSPFEDDSPTTTTVPNGVRIIDLEPGTCFQAPANTDVRVVEEVGCDRPHDAEAYAVFPLPFPADEPFPGGAEVQSLSQMGCQDRFGDYVGEAYEDSQYYISAVTPSRRSWEDRNDRRVLCSVIAADGGQLDDTVRSQADG